MARKREYVVGLTAEQRHEMRRLVGSGRRSAREITRARILLMADAAAGGRSDGEISAALGVGRATVERVRKRFAEGGLEAAIRTRPQPPRPEKRVLDGRGEARLVTLACLKAPEGHERWTLDLLADKMVRLNYVSGVSRDTVRRVLKKTSLSLG